jgi:hypothetical protein
LANTVFKLRRSSVAGKVPNTSTLAIGELGLNLTDRKLYSSDGTNVWETGANLTTLTVSTNTTVNNVIISGGIRANGAFGTANQVLTSNGSSVYWSTGGGGFTNGQSISVNNFVIAGNLTANSSNGSAGQFLASNGTGLYWSSVLSNNPVRQTFTGDGVTTTFSVSGGYTANNLDVYGNGVKYASSEVTTSSGSTIVFGVAPPNGVIIDVVGFTNALTTALNSVVRQTFTGDGSTTLFTVSGGYTPNYLDVYLNGIKLAGSEITVTSGSTVTISTAPPNGSIIDVVGYQVYSTSINTAASYIWSNTHTFSANIVANAIYSTSTINAASHTTGSYGSATGGVVANVTTIAVGNSTANVIISSNTVSVFGSNVGYMEVPQNSQSAAYTTVLSDNGKHILHPSSDNNARTFTIANNSSVAYPLGTVLTFINMANTVTIAINNDTMFLSSNGATGSRTVNTYGIVSAIKVGTTSWLISGSNLT